MSAKLKKHSIPVPRLYKEASKILQQYYNKEGAIKTLVYNGKYPDFRRIYALLCKVTGNVDAIKNIISSCKLLEEQPMFNPFLAQVLTTELLLGHGSLSGDCKPINIILEYKEKMMTSAEQYLKNGNLLSSSTPVGSVSSYPRYVRINTLVSSADYVHASLIQYGWSLKEYSQVSTSYDDFIELVWNIEPNSYLMDYHIPNLLVFPPNTPFWDSDLYQQNAIVLQDKASCLPAHISGVTPGSYVIDACAAPGNKTSQIAAMMEDNGTLFAYERDYKRYQTLQKMVNSRGLTCASLHLQDFSQVHLDDHKGVNIIFVDPSCSSSGIGIHNEPVSEERLKNLSTFQSSLLDHALSFPSVETVIYSTCSIYTQENEQVVQRALDRHVSFDLVDLSRCLAGWKHFGEGGLPCGSKVVRTKYPMDACQGFFLAKFVRRKDTKELGKSGKQRKRKKKFVAEKSHEKNKVSSEENEGDVRCVSKSSSGKKKRKFSPMNLERSEKMIHAEETKEEFKNYKCKKKRKKENKM